MKILNIHPHLTVYGGAEILLSHLTRELHQQGHQADILTLSLADSTAQKFHPSVGFVLPEKPIQYELRSRSCFSALGILNEIRLMRRLFRRVYRKYDFVIIHNFPATFVADIGDIKKIWMCNEPPMLCNNENPGVFLKIAVFIGAQVDRLNVAKNIDVAVVADAVNQRRFRGIYGFDPRINHYGIEHEKFAVGTPSGILDKVGIPPDWKVVLQVGVFSPQKNQMESLRVIDSLRNKIQDVRLILAGNNNNEYGALVKDEIRERRLENTVLLTGNLSQDEIAELYRRADAVIFPVKAQGGWLSPFEAISGQALVIVSAEFTAAEIVRKNRLGIVSDDFLRDLEKILINTPNYNFAFDTISAGDRSRWVRDNLKWSSFAENFSTYYREVGK